MTVELLAAPWRHVLGAFHDPASAETPRALLAGHPLPWRLELRTAVHDVPTAWWVSCARGADGLRGVPVLGRTEAAYLCAAAELDRFAHVDLAPLFARMRTRAKRPFGWVTFAGVVNVGPEDAGAWTLGRVLDRLGMTLVGATVVGAAIRVEAA